MPVTVDRRTPDGYRVHRIRAVTLQSDGDEPVSHSAWHELQHDSAFDSDAVYWMQTPRSSSAGPGATDELRFVNGQGRQGNARRGVAEVEAWCSNADLPTQLSFEDGPATIHATEPGAAALGHFMTRPAAPGSSLPAPALWRLIARLLPHVGAGQRADGAASSDGAASAAALREVPASVHFRMRMTWCARCSIRSSICGCAG